MSGRPSSSNSWINSACSERNENGRNRGRRIKEQKGKDRAPSSQPLFPKVLPSTGCPSRMMFSEFFRSHLQVWVQPPYSRSVSLSFPSIVSSSVPAHLLSTLLLFPDKAAVLGETSTICSAVVSKCRGAGCPVWQNRSCITLIHRCLLKDCLPSAVGTSWRKTETGAKRCGRQKLEEGRSWGKENSWRREIKLYLESRVFL